MFKKDELAIFTKLNIKADLCGMKKAFENSLSNPKEVHQKSLAKEKLKNQREFEKLKNNNIDVLILNTKTQIKATKNKFDLDDFVDKKYSS